MPIPKGYTLDQPVKLPSGYTLDGGANDGGAAAAAANPFGNAPAHAAAPPVTGTAAVLQKMAAPDPTPLSDLGVGVAKSVGNTANNLGKMVIPDGLLKAVGATPPSAAQQASYFAPQNTTQAVGKLAGDVGQFFIPGPAEEMGAAKLAPFLGKAGAKIATAALGSGAVNKAEGGSFTGGVVGGAIGSGVGQGLQAIAPHLAEAALNIRKLDRAYGKGGGKIGRAILDDTTGFSPDSIAAGAQDKLNALNPKLNSVVDQASIANPQTQRLKTMFGLPNPTGNDIASLAPARGVLGSAAATATRQGERTTLSQLQPMETHLGETIGGQPIGSDVTPRELLDLKRGFGNEFIHRWNPETMEGVKGTAAQTYHAMGQELNRVVPEAQDLNSQISTMIPIAKRAESAELNAPTVQRTLHRVTAHTGALAGTLYGGYQGYEKGGVPGAVGGALTGLVIPELLGSPTGAMALARGLNKAQLPTRLLTGAALQLDRPRSK